MNLLDACAKTREITTAALESALRELLAGAAPISETALRDLWLAKLRQHESLYPDGWYMPPPHGMFVQFAADTDPARITQPNNRPPAAWPRPDIFLDRTRGLLSAYASPVDRATGMIGDFGITLYFGANPDIRAHLAAALQLDYDLFAKLTPGLKFSDITRLGTDLITARGFFNGIVTQNDPTGTNIGHTVPASDTGWTAAEQAVFAAGNWTDTKDMIAGKRLYLNAAEQRVVPPNIAHTIEPRPQVPRRPDLPMISFHTIVIWRDGRKQLLTGFDGLFRLAGMDYMLGVGAGPDA